MLKESEFFFNFVFKGRFVLKFFFYCVFQIEIEREKRERS